MVNTEKLWQTIIKYLDSKEKPAKYACSTPDEVDCLERIHQFLLNGGDINTKDKNGQNLLHKCRNFRELAFILLLNGADVNAQDINGNTPYHNCCDALDTNLLWSMNEAGVDLLIKNNHGVSRYDHIKSLAKSSEDSTQGKRSELLRMADSIIQKNPTILTAGISEKEQNQLGDIFSSRVVEMTDQDAPIDKLSYGMILVNTDCISADWKHHVLFSKNTLNKKSADLPVFFLNNQKLNMLLDDRHWVMASFWPCLDITEDGFSEKLKFANSILL